MSIGFLKRFLGLARLAAVLIIAGAAWGYYSHLQSMRDQWRPPDFRPTVQPVKSGFTRIDALGMTLGRFQREIDMSDKPVEEKKTEDIEKELQRLGTIKSAVVVYPPYTDLVPTIIFEYRMAQPGQPKLRTLRLNEALKDRADPAYPLDRIAVAYKFIGCEPDADHPGWTFFLFDMKCDGTDIQKARWKLETEETSTLPSANADESGGLTTINNKKMYIGSGERERPKPKTPKPNAVTTRPVNTPPPVITTRDEPNTLFDDEDGTFAPTREGVAYLKDNYQKILKDTQTQTYKERGRAAGLEIIRISNSSLAGQFGILKRDVILSINGRPVTKQAEAVSIVKSELRKKVRIIKVKVLRRGREKELRFDTRDPETRRMAKRAGIR